MGGFMILSPEDKEFLEDMKTYEIDHEPDGWPAVQMHKITRLLDMIDKFNFDVVGKSRPMNKLEIALLSGDVNLDLYLEDTSTQQIRADIEEIKLKSVLSTRFK